MGSESSPIKKSEPVRLGNFEPVDRPSALGTQAPKSEDPGSGSSFGVADKCIDPFSAFQTSGLFRPSEHTARADLEAQINEAVDAMAIECGWLPQDTNKFREWAREQMLDAFRFTGKI